MSVNSTCRQLGIFLIFLVQILPASAQEKEGRKYPTLLWEIRGKGLKRPSYLFGTMHVSSKLVFHLSDSFYLGIRNSDVVALELDPQLWQDQLFRYQNMQANLRSYSQGSPNDYLNEKSFQLEKYEEKLRSALSEEPTVINGLLYRTEQPRADFEEDTYLDLYIYQTGKKLGKQSTGVENYIETEKLILEATQDMMKDRRKRNPDTDGESIYDIERKAQEAYRKGDLDLLDSLERIMQPSSAYLEKFLYRRNEIQANSIDSILRKHSLFVGVGAAHLPGRRGVIELLRKKGYQLRPIRMQDRDASQRDDIDKVKVPVIFFPFTSEDQSFTVQLPGKLYKRADSRGGDSWQYADMSNGAYYMITRVKTNRSLLGQRDATVLKKIDSLLYENVPGKILRKTAITRNGYPGFDLINKTRRGDIQRYNIFETPFEVLVFKMSGNGNYVQGSEGDQFFGSITLKKEDAGTWQDFEPSRGGFKVRFPEAPDEYRNNSGFDGIPRWEYEANDTATGDAYLVWKKSIQNYHFLDEDSFDLGLMNESFLLSERVEKQLKEQYGNYQGFSCLDATYLLKDDSYIRARFLIKGPQYFLLAVRSQNKEKSFSEFFNSFSFTPFKYSGFSEYTDTFVNISVTTPFVPDIDVNVRNIMERSNSEEFLNAVSEYNNYWPRNKTALFQDDFTGEAVYVSMETYPRYYFPRDSAFFWQEETNENKIKEDFIIRNKESFHFNDSVYGVKYAFTDTNSSRIIHSWIFVKDNRLYRITNLNDSLDPPSEFVRRFYSSIRPLDKNAGESVFKDKLPFFFHDFYSLDSTTNKRAKDAIPNINFGPQGVPQLLNAIRALPYNDRDYFMTKTKLINELGFINDSTVVTQVVRGLKEIYERAKDTSTIQNAVMISLARNKTREAYALLKTLLIQDPPVFDNASDYNYLFQDIGDSLTLARTLFPELLQLSSVDDYKENIRSLLTWLVDSSYLRAKDYEFYFSKIYFDAKIQLKKQLGRDEKQLQKKNESNGASEQTDETPRPESNTENELGDYAILLMPFYERYPSVHSFFDQLLRSKDGQLRMSAAILLLRNNMVVPDSIFQNLAASDEYRMGLLKMLRLIKREDQFPYQYKNQLALSRSQLVSGHPESDFFAIEYVDKRLVEFRQTRGYVYFYKYKISREADWEIGISGLQPVNPKEVDTGNDFVKLTNKKIRPDRPVVEQFDNQLKRLLFSKQKGGASFYLDHDYYPIRGEDEE
jgi:uncharacterized protein YbaP (TraB family)